jgi:hypothetical protein
VLLRRFVVMIVLMLYRVRKYEMWSMKLRASECHGDILSVSILWMSRRAAVSMMELPLSMYDGDSMRIHFKLTRCILRFAEFESEETRWSKRPSQVASIARTEPCSLHLQFFFLSISYFPTGVVSFYYGIGNRQVVAGRQTCLHPP